jgi:hypothetical protein
MSRPRIYTGTDPARQSIGLPGHCDDCAKRGHVLAHPDLGCADVGCDEAHSAVPYLVFVAVGDWTIGPVEVEADSVEDAKAKAEELVKTLTVKASWVREADR